MTELKRVLNLLPLVLLLVFELFSFPAFSAINESLPTFQKGMSFSAWSSDAFATAESDESLYLLTGTNTEWIAICFSWVQSNTTSDDIHADFERTPTTDSVKHAITVAHGLGLKVILKPMVDTLEEEKTQGYPTVWRGEIQPKQSWFDSYSIFINSFADVAEKYGVELFCVGCEFKATTGEKQQWEKVISGVRKHYSGPLTYAADWTNYQNIEWWDSLDYVGIDAYFPLSFFDDEPTVEELKSAWTNHANVIEEWVLKVNKPVIFTEIGYRSGDGTNMAPSNYWTDMPVDLKEQNDCYEAAFKVLWNRSWFYGFYWWTWIHDPTKGGVNDSTHTPQNKLAQETITAWYSVDRKIAIVDQSFASVSSANLNEEQFVGFHVIWQNVASDVVGAKVYVNGTEYLSNSTGWVNFSIKYGTTGERSWIVTDVQHPEADGYTMSASAPSITWNEIQNEPESTSKGNIPNIVLYVVVGLVAIGIVAVGLRLVRRKPKQMML
jgi:hypothetical protein